MRTERVEFLGVSFDLLPMDEVLDKLSRVRSGSPFSYVVTPNVDHVVRLEMSSEKETLSPLYNGAELSLCDSRILRHLARLHGLDLPLVAGSDLTVRLFDDVIGAGDRIAVIGGDVELLEQLRSRFPQLEIVHHSPPMGLRHNKAAKAEAARFVAQAQARFIFLAVGSPQQEMIAAEAKAQGATGVALCIGASLDFITGRERRAPRLLQRLSLEWAYRLFADPRRMWRRYLVEGPRVFVMAAKFRRSGSRG